MGLFSGVGRVQKYMIVAIFASVVFQVYHRTRKIEVHIDGQVDQKWQSVYDAFRQNLEDNWERSGGSFVVYHKGKKVVDIWGGYADKESGRKWKEDTLNLAFSCSKAFGALVIGKLVDQGRIQYDDLVVKHWPEFGKHGKENVTVEWLITHKAGLAYTDHPITFEMAKNPEVVDKVFEEQTPKWATGTKIGYHALTQGWLVDALVRRVDVKKRTIGQYFKEEIADKYDIDFYLGLPLLEQHRVSRLVNPTLFNVLEEITYAPRDFNILKFVKDKWNNGTWSKVEKTTPWIHFVEAMTLNDPDLHRIEQSAVMGIGTARAMAEVFELLRTGKLVSEKTQQLMFSDFELKEDCVSGAYVPRGKGFMLKEFQHNGENVKMYGHSGYGGQNIRTDFEQEITVAYLSNGLKVGFGDTARTYKRLLAAVYDVVIPRPQS